MVIKKSHKKGFTLIEVLTSMLIMSIFFAVMSKAITTKPKPAPPTQHNGYYECMLNSEGTKVSQRHVSDVIKETDLDTDKTSCEFTPPRGIPSATVIAITNSGDGKYNVYQQHVMQFTEDLNISTVELTDPTSYMVPDDTKTATGDLTNYINSMDNDSEIKKRIDDKEQFTPCLYIKWQ